MVIWLEICDRRAGYGSVRRNGGAPVAVLHHTNRYVIRTRTLITMHPSFRQPPPQILMGGPKGLAVVILAGRVFT